MIDVAFCPVRHIDRPLISADSNAAIESLTLANCGLRLVRAYKALRSVTGEVGSTFELAQKGFKGLTKKIQGKPVIKSPLIKLIRL